jgi:hypothetical protein
MATKKITLNELRSLVRQIIQEETSKISPELNNRIIKRTEELYKKNNGKTENDFNKYYDIAIKEFGYEPKIFKDYMEKYFTLLSDDDY